MLKNRQDRPLLTIAVPTYNRSAYLKRSLQNIITQIIEVDKFGESIELVVSDNCSTDETAEVVRSFSSRYSFIKYNKNDENGGPDKNFLKCVLLAKGKFTYLIGDDDILLPNSLGGIVNAIQRNQNSSIIMINGFRSASPEFNQTKEGLIIKEPSKIEYFNDKNRFLRTITLRAITFMSCIIFNNDYLRTVPDLEEGIGTHFVQTFWLLKTLSVCPRSVIFPFPWVSQGNAEPTINTEKHLEYNPAGQYSEDGTLIVHLQFYSIYLPKICKKYGYRVFTGGIIFSKYLYEVSISMLYDRFRKKSASIIKRQTLYKYTKNNMISWITLYPAILIPEPILNIFRPYALKLINSILSSRSRNSTIQS
jgi:glycosyltransferase involved in cell wall biosynthesis